MSAREAMQVVLDLLNKHDITSMNERYLIRERLSDDELEEFKKALEIIDGSGEIG